MNIQKVLDEFGLEKNKGKVYLAALGVGSGTTQEIATKASLPRTTVHEILQQLIALGLMSYLTKGRTRTYSPQPPEKLRSILKTKDQLLTAALPELASLLNTKGIRPRIQFFEGAAGVKTVFEDTLTVRNKILNGILSMEDLYKIPGKNFMDAYVEQRIAAGIKLRVIRSETKEVEETWPASNKENRELHIAPADMVFPMTIYIYDNKVGIIGTQKENFGMIIESEDFYNSLNNLFEVLWQVTRVASKKN